MNVKVEGFLFSCVLFQHISLYLIAFGMQYSGATEVGSRREKWTVTAANMQIWVPIIANQRALPALVSCLTVCHGQISLNKD